MNFKKVTLAALMLLALAAPVMASTNDLVELMRSDLRTNKRAIVTKAMQMDEASSAKFWPVYSEYETELTKLNDQRVTMIKDYAAAYNSMTDESAKDLIKRGFKLQESRTSLLKKYVGKMSKAVDVKTAARWAQVEHALDSAIDLQIASELPLLQ
jgi:ribosome-binding ATPase YchF (GTP1/OBG family)